MGVAGVASAPALRNLTMVGCKLTTTNVEGLSDHPTLQGAWLPLPRADLDRDTDAILGLPRPGEPPSIARAAGVMGLPVDEP